MQQEEDSKKAGDNSNNKYRLDDEVDPKKA